MENFPPEKSPGGQPSGKGNSEKPQQDDFAHWGQGQAAPQGDNPGGSYPPQAYPQQGSYPQQGAYAQQGSYPQHYAPPPVDPRARLTPPAIGLIVNGILSIFSSLLCVGYGIVIMLMMSTIQETIEQDLARQAGGAEQMSEAELQQMQQASGMIELFGQGYGIFLAGIGLVGIFCGSLSVFGGFRMLQARSYSWCVIGAVAGLVPLPGCWLLGIAMAIWALIILSDEHVKRLFR